MIKLANWEGEEEREMKKEKKKKETTAYSISGENSSENSPVRNLQQNSPSRNLWQEFQREISSKKSPGEKHTSVSFNTYNTASMYD